MAEFAVKVGDGTYEDGDVLCAFNSRFIGCVHMQQICHKRHALYNGSGLILPGSLTQRMLERVSQYRCVRTGRAKMDRITIATGAIDRLTEVPDEEGRYYHVEEFIRRALRFGERPMFAEPGREIWYGGRTDHTVKAVDDVWTEIETHSAERRADYQFLDLDVESEPTEITLAMTAEQRQRLLRRGRKPPFEIQYFGADREYHNGPEGAMVMAILGGEACREHFFVAVDDFDDRTSEDLVVPLTRDTGEMDENGQPIIEQAKKRKHQVDWRNLLGISAETISKIEDNRQYMDGRTKSSFARADIVTAKSLVG